MTIEGLRAGYRDGPDVLAGVDLTLRDGELTVVVGPNGSGKSTLVKAAAGLLRPRGGSVRVEGRELADLSDRDRARRVAVVPQNLDRWPSLKVFDLVASGRYAHLSWWRGPGDADRMAVEHALEQVGLADQAERPLTELSGGQRQRALVGRALAQSASVFLVDEPTNALDLSHQLDVFSSIGALTCEGRAVLTVTHDLNLASQFATRILLLVDGRFAAEGTPAEVLRPEVLGPVYGERLRFGSLPSPMADGERPYVLPWMS
jgi:iron complex transport system ATP-binding protein